MDNQHRKIPGYRELNPGDLDLINEVKDKATEVGALIERLEALDQIDKRWQSQRPISKRAS